MADKVPNPWKTFEPQPPRCNAVVVTDSNWDDVCRFFETEYIDGLVSATRSADRKAGVRTLTLKFESYELAVHPYDAIKRTVEDEGRYSVQPLRDFNREWREQLSP